MDDARLRLSKFVAREKVMKERGNLAASSSGAITESLPLNPSVSAKTKPATDRFADMSSPDSFDITKQRLSRMKPSPVKTAMSIRRSKDTVTNMTTSTPSTSPARLRSSSGKDGSSSPDDTPKRTSRRRVLLQSPSAASEKETSSTVKMRKSHESRSLSPLPGHRKSRSLIAHPPTTTKSKLMSSAEYWEDEDASVISLPFPSSARSHLDLSRRSMDSLELPAMNNSALSLSASVHKLDIPEANGRCDPVIDSKLCSSIVEDVLHWEAGMDMVLSRTDLWKRIKTIQTQLHRIGLEKILVFNKVHGTENYVLAGDSDSTVTTSAVDPVIAGIHRPVQQRDVLLFLSPQDERYEAVTRSFHIHEEFSTKLLHDSSQSARYIALAVRYQGTKSEAVESIVAFHVIQQGIRIPFHPLMGKQADALKGLLSSTLRLMIAQVWRGTCRTLERLENVDLAQRRLLEKQETLLQSQSNEALLAFSIWSNSTSIDLNMIATSLLKSSSIFNRESGNGWVLFYVKASSNLGESSSGSSHDGFTIGRCNLRQLSADTTVRLQYEQLPMLHPAASILAFDQYSQTQVISINDASILKWLTNDRLSSVDIPISLLRTQSLVDIHGRKLHCISFVPLVESVKKTLQVNHMRDLGLLTQSALTSVLDKCQGKRESIWSNAATLLANYNRNPGPNTVDLHDRSLFSLSNLIDTIQSNDFAESIGVRKVVVLLDSVMAATIGLSIENDDNSPFLSFVLQSRDDNSIKRIFPSLSRSESYPWLDDLNHGKVVLFNPNAAVMRERTLSQHLRGRGGNDRLTFSAQLDLWKFVTQFDAHVRSSMLLPIQIPNTDGTALCIFVDKMDDWESIGWSPSLIESSDRESTAFDVRILDRLEVLGIGKCLQRQLQDCKDSLQVIHEQVMEDNNLHQLQCETNFLTKALQRQSQQRVLTRCFLSWKVSSQAKALQEKLKHKEILLDYALSLTKFRQLPSLSSSATGLLESFLLVLESWLRKLFPGDAVSVQAINDSRSRVESIELPDSITISEHIVQTSHERETIVAMVKVSRSTAHRPFSFVDTKWITDICHVGSEILSALHQGFQQDGNDGDVRSLTIPMLENTFVPLMTALNNGDDNLQAFEEFIEQFCFWSKKAVGADLVMIDLRNDLFGGDRDHTVDSAWNSSSGRRIFSTESLSLLKSSQKQQESKRIGVSGNRKKILDVVTIAEQPSGTDMQSNTAVIGATFRCSSAQLGLSQDDTDMVEIGSARIVVPKTSQMNEEHTRLVEVMFFALTQLVVRKHSLIREQRNSKRKRQEIIEYSQQVNNLAEEFRMLQLQNDYLSSESVFWTQCVRFADALSTSNKLNIVQIGVLVAQHVPDILRCKTAALVINRQHIDWLGEGYPVSDDFLLISEEAHYNDWESFTARQLQDLSPFFDNGKSSTNRRISTFSTSSGSSVLVLTVPGTNRLFGAIVIQSEKNADREPPVLSKLQLIDTAVDAFMSFLNHGILASIVHWNRLQQFLVTSEEATKLSVTLSERMKDLKAKAELDVQLAKSEQSLRELQLDRESLLVDFDAQQKESRAVIDRLQLELKQKDDSMLDFNKKVAATLTEAELASNIAEEKCQQEKTLKANLLELTSKFAFDSRCQRETVLLWLKDIAQSRQCQYFGTRSSRFNDADPQRSSANEVDGIVGIWSAIGEATRTGKPVIYVTQFSDSSPLLHSSSSSLSGKHFTGPNDTNAIDVMCVPNRAIFSQQVSGSTAAVASTNKRTPVVAKTESCFVFVKRRTDSRESGIGEEDKLLLEAAANMASRLLDKSIAEVDSQEFFELEQQLRTAKVFNQRLVEAINLIRDLFATTSVQSSRELFALTKQCVCSVLQDTSKTIFDLDCHVAMTEQLSGKKWSSLDLRVRSAMQSAATSGEAVVDGSILAVPCGSIARRCEAVMVLEKKIRPSAVSQQESIDMSKVFINTFDEQVLRTVATCVSFVLDKLESVKEAFDSIQEAGNAISLMQGAKSSIEDQLVSEISSKSQCQTALRMSSELLSLASAQRTGVGQLLDCLRTQTLSLTAANDVCIFLPVAADTLLADILVEQPDADSIAKEMLNDSLSEYYTLLPESSLPSLARFEIGDVELQAIRGFRSLLHSNEDAASSPSSANWRSWVVRRVDSNRRLGATLQQTQQWIGDLNVMAVPFYLRTVSSDSLTQTATSQVNIQDVALESAILQKGRVGLIVVVRASSPFCEVERDCVYQLAQSFSFCVGNRGGELNARHSALQLRAMRAELKKLKAIENRYFHNLVDIEQLSKSLKFNGLLPGTALSPFAGLNLTASPFATMESALGDSLEQFVMSGGEEEKESAMQFECRAFLSAIAQQVFVNYNASTLSGEDQCLLIDEISERAWSDFFVANLNSATATTSSSNEAIDHSEATPFVLSNSVMGEDAFVRQGTIFQCLKYTLKFGFVSQRQRLTHNASVQQAFLSPLSGVRHCVCRLEIQGQRHIRYFMFAKDETSSQSLSESCDMDETVNAVVPSFNLMNLDLKLQLVEKLCCLQFQWKRSQVKIAEHVNKLLSDISVGKRAQETLSTESQLQMMSIKQKYVAAMDSEKEKSTATLQRHQSMQRLQESIQRAATLVAHFVFSLPIISIEQFGDLLHQLAESANYDYAMGNAVIGSQSDIRVSWLRNERHLAFPAGIVNKLVPSAHDTVKTFRILVFVNAIGSEGPSSSPSARLQQELQEFHEQCRRLEEHLSFHITVTVVECEAGRDSANADGLDGDSLRPEDDDYNSTIKRSVPAGTILVESPLLVLGNDDHTVHRTAVIQFSPSASHALVAKSTILSLFRSVHMLAVNCVMKHIHDKNVQQLVMHRKMHAITKLQSVQLTSLLDNYRRNAHLHIWKCHSVLPKRTVACRDLKEKLNAYVRRTSALESLSADWNELVKGIGGMTAFAVRGGPSSVWARASQSLISLLSSRCIVTDCSLIVASDMSSIDSLAQGTTVKRSNKKLTDHLQELVVRDVTGSLMSLRRRLTPSLTHLNKIDGPDADSISAVNESGFQFSDDSAMELALDDDDEHTIQEFAEFAHSALEVRAANQLGHRLGLQLIEVFSAPSVQSVQRLFRLNSEHNQQDAHRHQVSYLVPVRTAFKVVGALKVSLDQLHSSSVDDDTSLITSAIEGNLVNFADLFAPLLLSSHRFDECRLRAVSTDQHLHDAQQLLLQRSDQLAESVTHLEKLRQSWQRLASLSLPFAPSLVVPDNAQKLIVALDGLLADSIQHCARLLGEIWDCVVTVKIDSISLLSVVGLSELVDQTATEESKNPIELQEGNDGIIIRRLYSTAQETIGSLRMEFSTAEAALSARVYVDCLVKHISLFMIHIGERFMEALNTAMKNDECNAILERKKDEEMQRRESEEARRVCAHQLEVQRKWGQLSKECLQHTTTLTHSQQQLLVSLPTTGYSLTESLSSENTQSLLQTLQTVLYRVTLLLGSNCYGTNIAVLDGERSPAHSSDTDSKRSLLWVYGNHTVCDNTTGAESASSSNWSNLSDSARAIVVNLTNVCLSTAQQTKIDVHDDAIGVIHVIVLPLMFSYVPSNAVHNQQLRVIGALQILSVEKALPPQEASAINDSLLNESCSPSVLSVVSSISTDVLQDISAVVSRVLSFGIAQTIQSQRSIAHEASLVSLQLQSQEDIHFKTFVELSCRQWKAMTGLLSELHLLTDRLLQGSITLSEFLTFESLRPHLQELAMIMRWRIPVQSMTTSAKSRLHLSADNFDSAAVVAKSVISLSLAFGQPRTAEEVELSESHIDVVALDTLSSEMFQLLDSARSQELRLEHVRLAYHFVDVISQEVQSILSLFRRSHGFAVESSQSIDNAKMALERVRHKASRSLQDAQAQREEHMALLSSQQQEKSNLLSSATDFKSFCLQLIRSPVHSDSSLSVELLQSLTLLLEHSLTPPKSAEDILDFDQKANLPFFFQSSVKTLLQLSEKWAHKTLSITTASLPRDISLFVRKDVWASFSSSLATIADVKDREELVLLNSNVTPTEVVLVRSSSKAQSQREKSLDEKGPKSLLEKCLYSTETRSIVKHLHALHCNDQLGMDSLLLERLQHHKDLRVQFIGLKLRSNSKTCDAVLRFVMPLPVDARASHDSHSMTADRFFSHSKDLLTNAMDSRTIQSISLLDEFAFYLQSALIFFLQMRSASRAFASQLLSGHKTKILHVRENQEQQHSLDLIEQQFARFKKVQRIVLRECNHLLDVPMIGHGDSGARMMHPASLPPLMASQDSCMKVLSLLRTLLRSEGQALLLKDLTTVPHSYQLIFSGDAISWPGASQNTFATVTSAQSTAMPSSSSSNAISAIPRPSLVESCVHSRKTLIISNAPVDDRYSSQVDGIMSLGTPLMLVPMRGRNGVVIGVLLVAKNSDGSTFSSEDSAAAEMISALAAQSLYWCQGLSAVHQTLQKSLRKIDKLERKIVPAVTSAEAHL